MKQTMEITDLYKVASLLCVGAEVKGLKIVDKNMVLFEIEAHDLHLLENEYSNGRVYVNALELKEKLNVLKDVMFARLREQEPIKTFVR